MAIKKISEFTQSNNVNNLDLVLISQEDTGNYVSKYAESSALRSIGCYTFVCGISQSGATAPNLTDNFNNYGSSPVASYVGAGDYLITGFNNLLTSATHIEINLNGLPYTDHVKTEYVDDDTISIVSTSSGTATNGIMNVNGLYLKVITYL